MRTYCGCGGGNIIACSHAHTHRPTVTREHGAHLWVKGAMVIMDSLKHSKHKMQHTSFWQLKKPARCGKGVQKGTDVGLRWIPVRLVFVRSMLLVVESMQLRKYRLNWACSPDSQLPSPAAAVVGAESCKTTRLGAMDWPSIWGQNLVTLLS